MSSSTPSTTIHQNVVPSEVGWQFVPQYYTFVNKQPNRLHCFYTKSSTFSHGNEGEEIKPCFGQHEIHQKITSIGFQDCKVFIHSVDAQASANGGIIIQVIGEMSNRGETWRKFVQTFFLAEQPNGYFVLNDIFRFLKEDGVEGDDADESVEPEAEPAETVTALTPEAPQTPAREPTPPPAVPAAAAPSPPPSFSAPPEEAPTTDVPEPAPELPTSAPEPQPVVVATPPIQPNGHTVAPAEPEEPSPATPAPPAAAEKSPAPTPAAPQPAPPTSTPTSAPVAAAVAPPVAAAPSAPRSWASLAASNSKKWGSAVAQESRGLTETPATPVSSGGTQTPVAAAAPAASGHPRGPPNRNDHHPALQAAQAVNTPQCFVKGVVETIPPAALIATLTSKFGPIKDLDIVRSKACAFLEFSSVEAARRAIAASLNTNHGGEGGVFVDGEGETPVRIFIETRKERGDRPTPRPRGGAPPVNGENRGQGGYRGGRGSGRGGRGGPPPPGK